MPIANYILITVLCSASWSDWKERKIPNSLIFPAFILGLFLNIITRGTDGIILSLSGTGLGFLLLLIPFLLGGVSSGDLKLLMVIGCYGGINLVLPGFLTGALMGGIMALGLLIYQRTHGIKIESMPYGIPLSVGTLLVLLFDYWR